MSTRTDIEEIYRRNICARVEELIDAVLTETAIACACFPDMTQRAAAKKRLRREMAVTADEDSTGVKFETLEALRQGLEFASVAELFEA